MRTNSLCAHSAGAWRPMNSASRNPRWLAFLALAMTWKRAVTFDLQTASLHWLEVFRWRVIPLSDFETFRIFRFPPFAHALSPSCSVVVNVTFFSWLPPSALWSPWFAVLFVFVVVVFLLFFLFESQMSPHAFRSSLGQEMPVTLSS